MKRQIGHAGKFDNLRKLMYRKSPYYPNYIIKTKDWETIEMERTEEGNTLGDIAKHMGILPPDTKKEMVTVIYVMVISTKLRRKHEGVWYVNHHLNTNMYTDTLKETFNWEVEKQRIRDNLIHSLMHEVYLDMKFGNINPDIKGPEGEPIYKRDKLQISEEERLRLK